MQCPSCGIQAHEGQSHCARCDTPLPLYEPAQSGAGQNGNGYQNFGSPAPWEPEGQHTPPPFAATPPSAFPPPPQQQPPFPPPPQDSVPPSLQSGPSALAGAYAPPPRPDTEMTVQLGSDGWPQPPAPQQPPVPQPPAEDPGESTQWWTAALDEEPSGPLQPVNPDPFGQQPPPPADPWAAGGSFGGAQQLSPPAQQSWNGSAPTHNAAPAPPAQAHDDSIPDSWFAAPTPSAAANPPAPAPWESAPAYDAPQQQDFPQQGFQQQDFAQPGFPQDHGPQQGFQQQDFGQQGFPQDSQHGPQQGFPPQAQQQPTQYLAQGPADPYAQNHPGQPWQSTANDDKPLWDPNGPMPMTNSHRQPSPAGTSGRNRGLLIGVAVLLVAAVGAVAFVFLNNGDEAKPVSTVKPSPVATKPVKKTPVKSNPQAVAQGKKVNSLLNASQRSRQILGVALTQAASCGKLPKAIPTMERVVAQRQQQLTLAKGLQIPAFGANAIPLRNSLTNAIKFSLDADVALVNWAKAHQGCKGKTPSDPNYVNAGKLSNSASGAKNQFKAIWNKIAPTLGFQKRSQF